MNPVSYFADGEKFDLNKLSPVGVTEEQKKKQLAVVGASPGQLPSAKPTNGPLPKVASVVSGAGGSPAMQRGVDIRPSQPSALADVTGKVKEFLTRQLTSEEKKAPIVGNSDPEKLKRVPKWMKEMAAGARGER